MLFCKNYGLDSRSRSGILTAKSIRRWYEQFNVCGCLSVGHKRRGMSYAKPLRCGENIEAVLMSVEATPKKSVPIHQGLNPGKCFAEKNHACLVLKTSERGGRLFEIGIIQ